MEVLSCGSVRLRVFLQGVGFAASLNTSLIVAYICVIEIAPSASLCETNLVRCTGRARL